MPAPRLSTAIENNHDLYGVVFEHLGLTWNRSELMGFTLDQPPPYYSNLVTTSPDWRPDEVFAQIGGRAARHGWPTWGMKDSHGVLALEAHGLKPLFDAFWIGRDSSLARAATSAGATRVETVGDHAAWRSWLRGWDTDEQVGEAILRPTLLDEPTVAFVSCCDGEVLVAGCLLNRTGDAWGVSNTFGIDSVERAVALVSFVDAWTAGAPLVGYEWGAALEVMEAVGFERLGPLTVWASC